MKNKLLRLLFGLVAIITITSCSKSNDDDLNIPQNITIEVGEDYSLNINREWSTNKDFVATVDGSGKITGSHVGECDIVSGENKCHVTVKPNYTLYREPYFDVNMSKEYVMSLYGEPYNVSSNGNIVMYETGQDSAPYIMYTFEDGMLKSSSIVVRKTYESSLKLHLRNRYAYFQYSDGLYQYVNAYKADEVTLFVMYGSYNSTYYLVMYSPA